MDAIGRPPPTDKAKGLTSQHPVNRRSGMDPPGETGTGHQNNRCPVNLGQGRAFVKGAGPSRELTAVRQCLTFGAIMTDPAAPPPAPTDRRSFLQELGDALYPGDRLLPPTTLARIADSYDYTLRTRGPRPQSVLWAGWYSQWLRFRVLLGVIERHSWRTGGLVINDLGCGYGALFHHIKRKRFLKGGDYYGYDLSGSMVRAARQKTSDPRATFIESDRVTQDADYSFCSGTFGLRLDTPPAEWRLYVQQALKATAERSRRGLAFNLLDSRGEDDKETLYYADPEDYLDFCRRELSPNVTLKCDYAKKIDFTIWVRF